MVPVVHTTVSRTKAAEPEPEPELSGPLVLDLGTHQLTSLPTADGLKQLALLQQAGRTIVCCDLSNNRLTALGDALSALPDLETLNLSLNHISEISRDLSGAALPSHPELRHIDLSTNRLPTFAPKEWAVPKLVSLDLSANKLSEFDVSHLALPALARLNLSNNRLRRCASRSRDMTTLLRNPI